MALDDGENKYGGREERKTGGCSMDAAFLLLHLKQYKITSLGCEAVCASGKSSPVLSTVPAAVLTLQRAG